MADPDPIQEMINQLTDMVRLVQKKKMDLSDAPLLPGTDEALDDLENQVALFCGITKETLDELGLTDEEITKRLQNPSADMKVEEKRKIRQLNYLRKDAEEIRWMLDRAAKEAEKSLSNPVKPKTKEEKSKRKHQKRYKRLGGNDQWKAV